MPLRGSQELTQRSAPIKGGLQRGSAWLNPPPDPAVCQERGRRHTAPWGRSGGREGRRRGEGAPAGGPQRQAAGSRGRGGYRRRPAHLWATSANCARWKSAARRRISSQAAAIAAWPLHVSLRREGYGQRTGTNLLAAAAARRATCRAGAAAATVIKKPNPINKKKAVSPRGPGCSSWSPVEVAGEPCCQQRGPARCRRS